MEQFNGVRDQHQKELDGMGPKIAHNEAEIAKVMK
jgi:hypothetical protein